MIYEKINLFVLNEMPLGLGVLILAILLWICRNDLMDEGKEAQFKFTDVLCFEIKLDAQLLFYIAAQI